MKPVRKSGSFLFLFLLAVMPGAALCDEHVSIVVSGDMEVVFDWSSERCTRTNIPDLPVRALRDSSGQIQLFVSHNTGYRMQGDNFAALSMNCAPISKSTHEPDPSMFADNEWIAAVYSEDGTTVHALVHNEYHGHEHGKTQCPSGEYFKCWYNSITHSVSTDGGASFRAAPAAPDHFVAGLPETYHPDGGTYGVFSPSNIIKRDGFYYAFVKAQRYLTGQQSVCLMRTDNLDDPGSWRFWRRTGFDGKFADPYRDRPLDQRAATCRPIALDNIAQMYEGISWNTRLEKFVLVGTSSDPSMDPNPFGFFYAVSGDLIHWERRKLLLEVPLPWTVKDPRKTVYLYPTLIDHESDSRNFETTGKTAYLYFTRLNNGHSGLNRDLVRVPVSIDRTK